MQLTGKYQQGRKHTSIGTDTLDAGDPGPVSRVQRMFCSGRRVLLADQTSSLSNTGLKSRLIYVVDVVVGDFKLVLCSFESMERVVDYQWCCIAGSSHF